MSLQTGKEPNTEWLDKIRRHLAYSPFLEPHQCCTDTSTLQEQQNPARAATSSGVRTSTKKMQNKVISLKYNGLNYFRAFCRVKLSRIDGGVTLILPCILVTQNVSSSSFLPPDLTKMLTRLRSLATSIYASCCMHACNNINIR
jgi:hypothetical protein